MEKSELDKYIEQDIHKFAEIKHFKITKKELPPALAPKRRKRQVILSPITFTPFVLVNLIFYKYFIVFQQFLNLQPIILSPIIFSPLILSPAVLGPVNFFILNLFRIL